MNISILGSLVLASAFIVGMGWYVHNDTPQALSDIPWQKRIQQQGAGAAYRYFADRVEGLPSSLQHTYAHTFGAALYDTVGVEGIATCDDRFLYGCFHEFMGRAVIDLGIEGVEMLDAVCTDQPADDITFCQHGLGHGVQSYFGYDRVHLDEALAVCDRLAYTSDVGGCHGGVFMEYNLRTMAGTNSEPRRIAQSDIAAPCHSLDGTHRATCFFWQPQWWHVALLGGVGTSTPLFAQLGDYCQLATPHEDERVACARGIGSDAAIATQLDVVRTAELCDAATHTPRERFACRVQAARRVAQVFPDRAPRVCDGLPQEEIPHCIQGIRARTIEL